jgi:hypothetical protein
MADTVSEKKVQLAYDHEVERQSVDHGALKQLQETLPYSESAERKLVWKIDLTYVTAIS